MTLEYHDIDRIFDALQNLDRKLDDVKTTLGNVSTMASVSASKVADLTQRIEKLEARADEIREEAEKIKESSFKTTLKTNLLWGILAGVITIGGEFLIKGILHLP